MSLNWEYKRCKGQSRRPKFIIWMKFIAIVLFVCIAWGILHQNLAPYIYHIQLVQKETAIGKFIDWSNTRHWHISVLSPGYLANQPLPCSGYTPSQRLDKKYKYFLFSVLSLNTIQRQQTMIVLKPFGCLSITCLKLSFHQIPLSLWILNQVFLLHFCK